MASYIFMLHPPPSSHRWFRIWNFHIYQAIFFSLGTPKSITALNYIVFWIIYKTEVVSHNDLTFSDHREWTFLSLDSTWVQNLRPVETPGPIMLQRPPDIQFREITYLDLMLIKGSWSNYYCQISQPKFMVKSCLILLPIM